MNKKILGFSLVSSTLVGSVSGVVGAENYETEPYFLAPKDGSISEEVVVAINHAVIEWNALCDFVKNNYSDFSKKEQNILQQVENRKNKVLALRKRADDLIKDKHCENEIIIKPWDGEQKINEVKENYKFLFNFAGYNPLFDDEYNLMDLYFPEPKNCQDKKVLDGSCCSDKLKDNSKLSRLDADYKFYSNMIASSRKNLCSSEKRKIWEEKDLILYFQARKLTKKAIIEEEEKTEQTFQKGYSNCLDDCGIF